MQIAYNWLLYVCVNVHEKNFISNFYYTTVYNDINDKLKSELSKEFMKIPQFSVISG